MKYYTDGYVICRNPSQVGGGFTIVDGDGKLIRHELVEKTGFTNNDGEILGIYESLKMCSSGDQVSTDSMCCLTWVNAGSSKSRPDLDLILEECRLLASQKKVNLMWERRDYNLAGIYNETRPRAPLKKDRMVMPKDAMY